MKQEEILHTFMQGAGLEAEGNDTVALGSLIPALAPAGVEAVMKVHTQRIDRLLTLLPHDSLLHYKLLAVRGFSFSEYQQLFRQGVSEQALLDLPICKVLHISNQKERKRFILSLSDSYEDYLSLLRQFFQTHGSLRLQTFFFQTRFDGSDKVQRCAYAHSRKNRVGQEQGYGINGVRRPKKISKIKIICYGSN